jgi:MFS family permease
MQLVTPILIKEWGITPATMGTVTTISRWVGLIGTFIFPVLADLYGRRPALIWLILVDHRPTPTQGMKRADELVQCQCVVGTEVGLNLGACEPVS